MDLKTADLCDACQEAVACELPFLSFGKRRASSDNIRTVLYMQGISVLRGRCDCGHGCLCRQNSAESGSMTPQ
jgi:regulator of ribonuclease activity A